MRHPPHPVLSLCLIVLFIHTAPAAVPDSMDGLWLWTFTMPDGTTASPRLKLKQDGTKLTGISRIRPGTEAAITNGVSTGNEFRFEVVRRRGGMTAITRYSGRRDGEVLRGRVESDWSGTPTAYDFEAKRRPSIDGTWTWKVEYAGRPFDIRLRLKLDGNTLTGEFPIPGTRGLSITNGVFEDGHVAFETERPSRSGTGQVRQKFEGKLEGNTIKGTIETNRNDEEPTVDDWEAKRGQ